MRLTESRLSMLPHGRWPPRLLASASALDVWPSILPYTVNQIVEGAVIFLCVWLTIIVSFYPLIGKRQVWRKVILYPPQFLGGGINLLGAPGSVIEQNIFSGPCQYRHCSS